MNKYTSNSLSEQVKVSTSRGKQKNQERRLQIFVAE